MDDNAQLCPCCGANQTAPAASVATAQPVSVPLEKHTGLTVLGFFIPLAALIMWLMWKDTEPSKAMAAAKGGLMYLSLSPVIGLVIYLLMKDKYHDIAKACGICAIVGVVLGVLYFILYIFLIIVMMMFA